MRCCSGGESLATLFDRLAPKKKPFNAPESNKPLQLHGRLSGMKHSQKCQMMPLQVRMLKIMSADACEIVLIDIPDRKLRASDPEELEDDQTLKKILTPE